MITGYIQCLIYPILIFATKFTPSLTWLSLKFASIAVGYFTVGSFMLAGLAWYTLQSPMLMVSLTFTTVLDIKIVKFLLIYYTVVPALHRQFLNEFLGLTVLLCV